MATYHQMGHHSFNLTKLEELSNFDGVILSPTNCNKNKILDQINYFTEYGDFDIVFDPQLYFPWKHCKEKLTEWDYFPETIDISGAFSFEKWKKFLKKLSSILIELNPGFVCSPAFYPKIFEDDYYMFLIDLYNYLADQVYNSSIEPIQTILVNMNDIDNCNRAMKIASLISKTNSNKIYLIFSSSKKPRRELDDTEELKGAMKIIEKLEQAGFTVIVGYCSTEFILWKYAGASICATGKYFNLRRFVSSRFEDNSEGGGGQLPYWFEESLLGFLRETDLIRINKKNLICNESLKNPFVKEILELANEGFKQPWLGLSWRQYLYQFNYLDKRIDNDEVEIIDLIKRAEKSWNELDEKNILTEEFKNNGEWVRAWHRVLIEYENFY